MMIYKKNFFDFLCIFSYNLLPSLSISDHLPLRLVSNSTIDKIYSRALSLLLNFSHTRFYRKNYNSSYFISIRSLIAVNHTSTLLCHETTLEIECEKNHTPFFFPKRILYLLESYSKNSLHPKHSQKNLYNDVYQHTFFAPLYEYCIQLGDVVALL